MTTPSTTTFMGFWKALNAALAEQGKPELRLADARHFWAVATDYDQTDRAQSLARRLRRLAA